MIGPFISIAEFESEYLVAYEGALVDMPVQWVSGQPLGQKTVEYLPYPSRFFRSCLPYQSWTNLCDAVKYLGENI